MNSLGIIYIVLMSGSIFFLIMNAVLQIRVKRIAEETHTIVNSQRTMLLRLIAALSQRIADENPTDREAQNAARFAKEDAGMSEHPRRVSK